MGLLDDVRSTRTCLRDGTPMDPQHGNWMVQQVVKRGATPEEGVFLTGQLFTMQVWVCPMCRMVEFADMEMT